MAENYFTQMEAELERQINLVTSQFQNLPEETLSARPAPDSWSIAECLHHLNTYGNYYLPRLEKALANAKKTPVSNPKSSWMGNKFVDMMDIEKSSKKYKARKIHWPDNTLPPYETLAIHLDQQEQLLKLVRAFTRVNANKKSIPTSVMKFVKLSPLDAMRFLVAHNKRHLAQAERVIKIKKVA